MKRKLKAGKSVKGTPPITKFFKRNPDIKGKPLTAVVKIFDISPSKASGGNNNTENKRVKETESEIKVNNNKHSPRTGESIKEIVAIDKLNRKHVNDLGRCAENIVDKKFKENGLENSPEKHFLQKGAKKCLFNHSDVNHSPDRNSVVSHATEQASNVSLSSNTEIESHRGSLKNSVEHSKQRSSECKSISVKLSNETDRNQLGSRFVNSERLVSVTAKESLVKEAGFSCESKANHFPDRETVDFHSAPTKSFLSLKDNAACKETIRAEVSVDNSSSSLQHFSKTETLEKMDELQTMETDCVDNKGVSEFTTNEEEAEYQEQCATKCKNMNEEMDSGLGSVEEDFPHGSVEKNKVNGDTRRLSEDNVEDDSTNTEDQTDSDQCDDGSSDEELFNPVSFLSDNRVKPDVRTPEKGTTPITGSPFTPVSPYVPQSKALGVRLKYSLDQLLLEKPKQIAKEKALAGLQRAMQKAIETSKKAGITDDSSREHQDGEKALLPIHQKELEKYKSTDEGFSVETPGLNVFPGLREPVKHENGCSQPFPIEAVEAVDLDEFTTFLYQRSDVEIRELLCCDWITHKYLIRPCPPAVVQWLFHILCYHLDNHTVKASYNALWSILNVGDNEETRKELSWIPSVQNMINVFKFYGVNLTAVLANVRNGMDSMENLVSVTCKQNDCTDKKDEQVWSFFPLVNFTRLIQFMTLCLDRYPTSYSTNDIEQLVVLLYCISLDEHLVICQHDIKTCLQAAYAAVESSDWIEELIKVSSVIHRIETCHRNKLGVVQLQPFSGRGRDVKRLAALQTMASLFQNNTSFAVNSFIKSDPVVNEDKEVTDTIEMFTKLETLLHEVNLDGDKVYYYKLYTMIELMDVVVGSERLQSPEKAIIDKLTKKLKSIHSDIKDPRAFFMSRSQVKDLVLRTITKFSYMIQGKKGTDSQKTITKFFVEGKSDLRIETLKDSEVVEEDEQESQESQSSSFIMDPLSQTIDNSDNESLPESQESHSLHDVN